MLVLLGKRPPSYENPQPKWGIVEREPVEPFTTQERWRNHSSDPEGYFRGWQFKLAEVDLKP